MTIEYFEEDLCRYCSHLISWHSLHRYCNFAFLTFEITGPIHCAATSCYCQRVGVKDNLRFLEHKYTETYEQKTV